MLSMNIGDVLDHAVALFGDRPALVDGATQYTYREAAERVRRLAGGLLKVGVQPGSHIGILAANSYRYWEAYFGAYFAGTPLAPLNIRLSAAELEFIMRDGELRALLIGPEYVPLLEQFHAQLAQLDTVIVLADEAPSGMFTYEAVLEAADPVKVSAREWHDDDIFNLCYTGGTTGLPKGVMLSQRNVISNAQHMLMHFGTGEDDGWLHAAPMFHLADAWACYAMTMVGARHIFLPGFTPEAFLDTVQRDHPTMTILVPTMINFVVNHPLVQDYDVSSLRLLLFGASPMPVDRIQSAVKIFGPILAQAYGMTETAPLLTAYKLGWIDYDTEKGIARLASCGREVSGVRIRVVDEHDNDVAANRVGEIIVRGANIMLGYWKRPEETALALRGGWMRTGDVGRMDEDGYLFIVDRAKDMIISGGENIYTTETENALYAHPAVLEVAVIGIPDETWGEAVHAMVVLRPEAAATESELIEHCHGLIAGYKCPKSVAFSKDLLPKSGAGKILKTDLRAPYWEGQAKQVH